jgi:hypothetical protein
VGLRLHLPDSNSQKEEAAAKEIAPEEVQTTSSPKMLEKQIVAQKKAFEAFQKT